MQINPEISETRFYDTSVDGTHTHMEASVVGLLCLLTVMNGGMVNCRTASSISV